MTEGMTFTVAGDKARIKYQLDRNDPSGVEFSHKDVKSLPDDELLQLAQLNINPPPILLGEIARRELTGKFRALWQAGESGGGHL